MDATREVKDLMFDAIGDEDDVHALVRNLDAAGFAVVPKTPTREMWAAGGDACVTLGNVHHDRITGDVWPAMVAAGAVKP